MKIDRDGEYNEQARALLVRNGEPLASTRGVDRLSSITAELVFALTAAADPDVAVAAGAAGVD
jgi:hypothetical protein